MKKTEQDLVQELDRIATICGAIQIQIAEGMTELKRFTEIIGKSLLNEIESLSAIKKELEISNYNKTEGKLLVETACTAMNFQKAVSDKVAEAKESVKVSDFDLTLAEITWERVHEALKQFYLNIGQDKAGMIEFLDRFSAKKIGQLKDRPEVWADILAFLE